MGKGNDSQLHPILHLMLLHPQLYPMIHYNYSFTARPSR